MELRGESILRPLNGHPTPNMMFNVPLFYPSFGAMKQQICVLISTLPLRSEPPVRLLTCDILRSHLFDIYVSPSHKFDRVISLHSSLRMTPR
jgi:hypothetical protein